MAQHGVELTVVAALGMVMGPPLLGSLADYSRSRSVVELSLRPRRPFGGLLSLGRWAHQSPRRTMART